MPVARSSEHPTFAVTGSTENVTVTGLASPSRGATEILLYRIDLGPSAALPPHHHDHEEVLHLLSGTRTIRSNGASTIPPWTQ